jgi:signal transduction histidine kinase
MSAPMRSWLSRYWPMLTVLVLGFTVSGWLGVTEFREGQILDRKRFDVEAVQVAAALEMNMERYEERLARLADHCATFEELPTAVWYFRRNTVTDIQGNLPAVMLAVYCPKVAAADFQAHLERGRAVWPNDYVFDPANRLGRAYALPVWQNWNRTGFIPVPLGTDMMVANGSFPSLQPMLPKSRAWSDARPSTVRRIDGQVVNGFWFGHTLYNHDQANIGPAGRKETVAQFAKRAQSFNTGVAKGVFAVFVSTDYFVDRVYNSTARASRVHVRLFSEREPNPKALLNPATTAPPSPRHRRTLVIPWYGLRWCIELVSTPLFEAESASQRAWTFGLGGAGFTVFAAILIGVSIRARVRQERLTAEITEARNTLAATEQERERMGDDLHDGAIQSLYAIQLGLTRTARQVGDALPSAARVLDETRQRMDGVIAELRRFILSSEERGAPAEAPPLEHVLTSVVQSLRATTPAELLLEAPPGSAAGLSSSQSVALAQLARSALGNALRHAEASRISVRLQQENEKVLLVVQDNGKGFSVTERENAGVGIPSMRKRAAEAGGELMIESAAGGGTRVEVSLALIVEPGKRIGNGAARAIDHPAA